jgi:hypothetical protein
MARQHRQVEHIEFQPGGADDVLGAMETINLAEDGWVNILPGIETDDAPPPSMGIGALFSQRARGVVMGTWAPPKKASRGQKVNSIGILHAAGRFASRQLREIGTPVPEGWFIRQDNPKRGLIVEPPAGTPVAEMLNWMVAVLTAFSTLELTGSWRADAFMPKPPK